MLPSPAITGGADKKPIGLSLNIPGTSPVMPLRKLENMMLNQLIPLESPQGLDKDSNSPNQLNNLPSPTQLFGLPMMWNFEEKPSSPLNQWGKMALSASPNIQSFRKELHVSPDKDFPTSAPVIDTPPKSARPREGTVKENVGKKTKV